MMSGPERSLNWLSYRRFALVLALLVAASFPEVIAGVETFVFRDYGLFGYPLAHYHRQSLLQGEIPLWNPLSSLGLPYLAQWNTLVLYPFSFIYLLFPVQWSLAIFCLFHLYLGGLGMYRLAHRWTWSMLGSSVAGLAYAFNGLMLNSLMWPNNIAALGLMPWVVIWVERGCREGGRAWFWAALVGGCQMLSGAPEIIIFTWLLLSALIIGQCFHLRETSYFFRFCGLVLLIAGLAAAQLLPTAELLKHSHRSQNYSAGEWAMPIWGWANLIHPLFYGYKSTPGVYFQRDQFWTTSYYPGIIVLTLGLLAWRVGKKRVWLLLAALLFALLLALGTPGKVYAFLEIVFPQIRFARFPIKFVVIAIFLFPILAAYGIRWMAQPWVDRENQGEPRLVPELDRALQEKGARWALAITGLLLVALTVISYAFPKPTDDTQPLWLNPAIRAVFLALGTTLLFLLPRQSRFKSRVIVQILLLVVLWLDVWTHMPNQNPTVRPSVYSSEWRQKGIDAKPKHGQGRVMLSPDAHIRLSQSFLADPYKFYLINRQALYANCNLLDDIPKVNGFYSLYVKESDELASQISTNRYSQQILDFLGVVYRTEPNKVFDWLPRANAMPLATIGQEPRPMGGKEAIDFLTGPEFDPRKVVVLESNAVTSAQGDPQARISSATYRSQRIDLETEASQPALVVVAQSWYPAWEARLDGQKIPILRANYGFQAMEVPAGKHRVELVYRDQKFRLGAVISLGSLGICLVGLWVGRRPVGSSRVDLQACKLEYSIVSPK